MRCPTAWKALTIVGLHADLGLGDYRAYPSLLDFYLHLDWHADDDRPLRTGYLHFRFKLNRIDIGWPRLTYDGKRKS